MKRVSFEELCELPEGTIFCCLGSADLSYKRRGEVVRLKENKITGCYICDLRPSDLTEEEPKVNEDEYFQEADSAIFNQKFLALTDADVLTLIGLLAAKEY